MEWKSGDTVRFCSEEAHRCKMLDHSAACNRHRHIRHRKSTIKITADHKKLAPLTTRSSSLRCVSAAEHQTAEQYSKTGRTKPLKHLPRSSLSWNTYQHFLKIPSRGKLLWKQSEDASQKSSWNQMSLPI